MPDALVETVKLVGTFGLGFGARWLQAKYSAEAKAIRSALDALDDVVNRAENSARSILAETPNVALACEVMTNRTHLGTLLDRTMKTWDGYADVPNALAMLGIEMSVADPSDGRPVSEARIEQMRVAQQRLRQAVVTCAEGRLSWRWFRWDASAKP